MPNNRSSIIIRQCGFLKRDGGLAFLTNSRPGPYNYSQSSEIQGWWAINHYVSHHFLRTNTLNGEITWKRGVVVY